MLLRDHLGATSLGVGAQEVVHRRVDLEEAGVRSHQNEANPLWFFTLRLVRLHSYEQKLFNASSMARP